MTPSPVRTGILEGRRARPSRRSPSLDLHGDEPCAGDDGAQPRHALAVVVGDVVQRGHAQGGGGAADELDLALVIRGPLLTQARGDRALGEVVDPLPPPAFHAHQVARGEQLLGGALEGRPVPPRTAEPGTAELTRGERPFGLEAGEHRPPGLRWTSKRAGMASATHGVPRPILDRQDAGGVGPVLEGPGRPRPVRQLDRPAPDRAEPGVRNELVRPREDADRVELHRAERAKDPGGPRPPVGAADEPLCPQRDAPGVVATQRCCWSRQSRQRP